MTNIDMEERRRSESCYYSDGVECKARNCAKCGWNPVIVTLRKRSTRDRIRREAMKDRPVRLLEVEP